jgi:hypothetical protein
MAIIQILSGSLPSILSSDKDIRKILGSARQMKISCPVSFICSELTMPSKKGNKDESQVDKLR